MAKKPTQQKENKASPKKIEPAIIVALIALAGTLTTALLNSSVIVEWLKQRSQTAETAPATVPAAAAPASANPGFASSTGGDGTCLSDYFSDVDPARQISIEVGVTAQDYAFPAADLDAPNPIGPFGIKLTQNGKMISAIHFLFFTDSDLFKLTSVVDANCAPVADYGNALGGDQNAIQNSGWLNLQLNEGLFTLNFQRWGVNKIRFNFQQVQ